AQPEGAVVMKIVAQEHIGDGSLLGDGAHGGMRVERGHFREPAAVGNAGNPHAAVVTGNIFEQPLDGIVGVGALVDRAGVRAVPGRPQHHKFAAGIEAATNVLNDKNVAAGQHFGIGGEVAGVAGGVVGGAVE